MLLAIDPGADAGWALYDADRQLVACGLGDPRGSEKHRIADIHRVIIERPMIYPGGRKKARPADVIVLAVRAGEWGGLYRQWPGIEIEYVQPFQWKGSVPKDIHHARTWAKLSGAERAAAYDSVGHGGPGGRSIAPSKRHNVLDAIGLGLFGVGR